MLITPDQIRAARALLRIDQAMLAHNAGISLITLRRLEDPDGLAKVEPAIVDTVRTVLEKAGAEFVERGVRHKAATSDNIRSIKLEIDRLVTRSAALLAKNPAASRKENDR